MIIKTIGKIIEWKRLEYISGEEVKNALAAREHGSNQNHWVSVRKYNRVYYKIDSIGSKVTPWSGEWADFNNDYYSDKVMIFASTEAADAWQAQLGFGSVAAIEKKRHEIADEMAKIYAKKNFSSITKRSRSDSDDAFSSPSGAAAAAKKPRNFQPGELFRIASMRCS